MEEPKDKALDEVFDSALALHHEITEGTEETASKGLQDKVKKAILMLEDATRLSMLFALRFEQTNSGSVRSVLSLLTI